MLETKKFIHYYFFKQSNFFSVKIQTNHFYIYTCIYYVSQVVTSALKYVTNKTQSIIICHIKFTLHLPLLYNFIVFSAGGFVIFFINAYSIFSSISDVIVYVCFRTMEIHEVKCHVLVTAIRSSDHIHRLWKTLT